MKKTLSRDEWLAQGRALYGEEMRAWKFRCVRCGNVQSHETVKARNPEVTGTEQWIYYACEGRHTKGIGCDWSLGGLFRIHEVEVLDGGKSTPCFAFADEVVRVKEPAS